LQLGRLRRWPLASCRSPLVLTVLHPPPCRADALKIPVVLFCALIVTLVVPEAPIPPTHRTLGSGLRSLDWLGTVLLIGSTTTLILGLSFHTSYLEPWSAPIVWGNLLAALLASIALVWVEGKVKRPLIPLELFADRHTAAIMASGFFLSVVAQAFVSGLPVPTVHLLHLHHDFAERGTR
jgi:hypothetical protein